MNGSSPQREALRRLRTNLCAAARGTELHALLVTSAGPGEGKSTVLAYLAVAMAQAGQRVLTVDGDLRRPTLHTIGPISNKIGLSSVLTGELTLQEAVKETRISTISVLTSGPLGSNPAELLCSDQMKALLEEMTQHFDLVLVDAPAFLPVADSAVLAPLVDGVLLVVARAQAGSEAVRSACRGLTDLGAWIVGLVFNRAREGPGYRYYKYYRLPDAALRGDPLTRIHGISPIYEKTLIALSIVSFAHLAEQDPEYLAKIIGVPVTAEQIRQQRWVEQAQAILQASVDE